jgi:CO dehydrogenase nickel-insertion accessory protein CooC1
MLDFMNDETEPKLAPPGAGLPWPELYIARLLFGFRRATGSRAEFAARFQSEREEIRRLIANVTDEERARRVLIDRVRGLEDSSRYWSIWMTLDHLRIIHGVIDLTLRALANGKKIDRVASTADVKPDPNVTALVVAEYEASCDALVETAQSIANLRTTARYRHPWFGELDAAGWHALSATHLAIHRKQIAQIREKLESKRAT